MVVELTDDNFEEEVVNSDTPVLIDFYAEWCAPCEDMVPRIEELDELYKGNVKFCRCDSDANRKVRIKFLVAALPYMVLIHDGKKSPLFDEAVSAERLSNRINEVLEKGSAPTTTPFKW